MSCVATPVRFRLRLRSGAAMAAFSRWIRSAGNAGLVRMSSQILSASSTWRMWIESEVGETVPARNSIRSLIWSAVIVVVPPERITEPVRFCSPSLSAGSRNERAPPPPPPPGRWGAKTYSSSMPRRPPPPPPPPATGVSSVASNQGIS